MFKKKFLKTKPICKVIFELPENVRDGAQEAYLVGDFNNWDERATPMQKHRDHRFTVTVDLADNRDYQFRYLVNNKFWHNDEAADKYVPNPFSGDNSVISTFPGKDGQ